MRRPSARILRNTVTVQLTDGWVKDAAASRKADFGPPSAPIRCRVHPASSREVPDHLRDSGVEYLTVHFFDDPGTRIRSRIHWLDFDPPKLLTVTGPTRTAAGELATWLVDCESRPI